MKPVKIAMEEVHIPSTNSLAHNLLSPLAELLAVLRLLGVVPYVFDKTLKLYILRWRSVPAVLSIITAAYLSMAIAVGVVGLMMTVATPPVFHTTEEEIKFIWQMMVVVLFGSMLLNAWSQTVSMLFAGHRLCSLLNAWILMESSVDVTHTNALKKQVRFQLAFITATSLSILSCVLASSPYVLLIGFDGVASTLFLVPSHWLEFSPFLMQVTSYFLF